MIGGETLKTALLAIRLFLSLHMGSLNPLLLRRDHCRSRPNQSYEDAIFMSYCSERPLQSLARLEKIKGRSKAALGFWQKSMVLSQ